MKNTGPFFPILLFFSVCSTLAAADVVFSSPEDAVAFAVQNSQTYTLQRQSALQTMKAAKFGIQDFLPTLSFSLSETDSTALVSGDSRSKTFQFSVSQEIFDGGKKKLAYVMNRIDSLYAYREFESSLRNFSSDIISRYYRLLMQQELVVIKEDLVTAARTQLQIMEKEVELGMTLETDYLEYLISFIQIEQERDQARRDLASLERRFKAAVELPYEARFTIQDDFYRDFDSFYYEPYAAYLWALIKTASVELKKQDLDLEYSRKRLAYSRRWYLPSLSAQGSVSFSGDHYPLTEPKYSVKLIVNFTNSSLFPLSLSNGYGFERDRLYNVNNSADVSIAPNPAYGVQRKLADIALLQSTVRRISSEKELHETVYDTVVSHDNNLRGADAAERTIGLLERRLEFSRHELESGEKKHIDYLEELISLAETRAALLEYQTQAAALERVLEILADMPFGELKHACINP